MDGRLARNLIAVLIVVVVLALMVVLGGCVAHYEAEIRPDGSGWVNIWTTREFPEGMKTRYKDFEFEANSVQGGLTMQDVVNLATFLKAQGISVPGAPTATGQ